MHLSFARHALLAVPLAIAAPALAQDVPEEIGTAVEAADTAGVVETLVADGPVTVFVPTNDAIAAAPQDALSELLADPDRLGEVIRGYAVTGKLTAADATELASNTGGSTVLDTLAGGTLTLTAEGGTVMVGPSEDAMATVTTPDLEFGDMTVHVIDTAFLPQ